MSDHIFKDILLW